MATEASNLRGCRASSSRAAKDRRRARSRRRRTAPVMIEASMASFHPKSNHPIKHQSYEQRSHQPDLLRQQRPNSPEEATDHQ